MAEAVCCLLGRRIHDLRESRGLVLREMASLSGLSVTHLSEIERGKVAPTLKVLNRLADALGVGVEYLIDLPPLGLWRVRTAAQRRILRCDDGHSKLERLSEPWAGGALTLHLVKVAPGSTVPGEDPPAEELMHVLSGDLEVRAAGARHALRAGESFHIRTSRQLCVSNQSPEPAELLWAARPAAHL
ncbi:MAG: helix-turn-helix domain-containing protein [Candidatus Eisenbacteria bacterium]|nr:helix-turn-helix domain-containing protein [Candidatus Eisenbacteria bacterium]